MTDWRTKHGKSQTSEYHIWESMKGRCNNPNNPKYEIYGKRGIAICERWINSFENFFNDMGFRPSAAHSIDRIDNSLGYYPDNCKWSDRFEQANNKRNNVFIEFDGESRTISQWAREKGMLTATLAARLRADWTIKRALNYPVQNKRSA